MPPGCRSVEKDGLAACKLIGSFHPLIVRDGRENDKEARVFTPALTTIDTGLFIFYNQTYCDIWFLVASSKSYAGTFNVFVDRHGLRQFVRPDTAAEILWTKPAVRGLGDSQLSTKCMFRHSSGRNSSVGPKNERSHCFS